VAGDAGGRQLRDGIAVVQAMWARGAIEALEAFVARV
jgi:hypothetical protein